jgi:hypothetical protein
MNCEEAKIKLNALIDSEIDEKDVAPMISHLESCYRCREEYVSLLNLQKKMKGLPMPMPEKEWFEELPRRLFRRAGSIVGWVFFIGSYALLLGYAFYNLFASQDESLFIKLVIGGIILGFFVLLGVTLSDRIRESKTDRYKDVMK